MPTQTRRTQAKATAPKPGPASAAHNGSKPSTFKLSADDLASLKSTRGRKATPSIYHAEVQAALQAIGEPQGIKITGGMKASKIAAELRKAAKELDAENPNLNLQKRITIFNREDRGFVAFVVSAVKEEKVTEKTSQPGSR